MKIYAFNFSKDFFFSVIFKVGQSCAMDRKKEREWHIYLQKSSSALRGEV